MLPDPDREKLRLQLMRDEGCVLHAYQDSEGWWTLGVGHLIDKRKGGSIPAKIAMDLLDYDIDRTIHALFARFPWVMNLAPPRQAALCNMAFNLGLDGLALFKNTLAAAERGEWAKVKAGVLRSKYHTQVGKRAERVAEQLFSGEWVE